MNQELLNKAQNGDTQAMVDLANYYLFEAKDVNEGTDWADKAITLGDWSALPFAVYGHNTRLVSCAGVPMDFTALMHEDCDTLIKYVPAITKSLPYINNEAFKRMMADAVYNARFYKALLLYDDNKEENADIIIGMLDGVDTTKAKMLYGLALLMCKEDRQGYYVLVDAYNDKEYCAAPKPFRDDYVYTCMISTLAIGYRSGDITGTSNFVKAVEVLQYGQSTIREEEFVKNISGELQHYRKTFFGWKYS